MRLLGRPAFLIALVILTSLPATAAPPVALERELRFDAARISLVHRDGVTMVEVPGAARELATGQPDLPVVAEPIDLPDGVRVTRVDVVSIDTAVLSAHARVPPAIAARPGLGPVVRTAPDPVSYGRVGFAPSGSLAELGIQGWMRGRHLAWLKVSPVRWDPATGRLERITRMTVRLTLEPHDDTDRVGRERIVPEWEDERAPAGSRLSSVAGRPAEPFKATQIPSVLGSPVAYVIVTSDALAAEFQRLADWKTQNGVPAVVRTMSFIRAQYPSGTDDADRIRQFLRDAYARWGTKWVLLGGDTDVIPCRTARSVFVVGLEDIPADLYFSCLDGNWNKDGDSIYGEPMAGAGTGDAADLMPEVYVGRAPVSTVADVQRFVNKNFQYTRTPVGDYEHMIDFFAEVLFPTPWSQEQTTILDGAELVEEVLPSVQSIPALHYLRLYQNHTDSRWSPGSLQETKARVLDSLNAGYNMTIHIGHGYRTVMSVADGNLENSDALAMTNGDRLTNLYSINCTSNAIDFPCIGEAFMHAPNGGAVTNVGSSRLDFPDLGRGFQKKYFELMFEDSVTAVGEAQAKQKLPYVANSTSDNIYRWIEMTLLMLGDPELRQWTGKPRALTVVHPSTFALSDTTMTVNVSILGTPLYGARVTLYKPDDDYRSATTDGAGDAVLDFRPGATGTFYLTVSGFNCRPLQDTLTVGAAAAPALADLTPVIDDDSAGGTIGNADGLFDAGETIDLQVPIINRGGATAADVVGALSSTDGMVTVVGASVSYGTIAAGVTTPSPAPFRLSLPYTCPDQREMPFTLSLLDDGGRHYVQRFSLTARAPEPRHIGHTIQDVTGGGNGNGIPEAGEPITMLARLRNMGTGRANGVTAILRNYDGLATVTDSSAIFGDLATGQEVQGDALAYTPTSALAKLELRISNDYGLLSTKTVDLVSPGVPTNLVGLGSQGSISLTWTKATAADLAGYSIYRSTAEGGPYAKVNVVPTDRTAYYRNEGLTPLTRYYYRVAALDSSANESGPSAATGVSTTPPHHAVFPVEMRRSSPASVAIEHVYQSSMMDIVAGSDVVYLWHADGTAPIDADGTSVTHGDFTTRGSYYAAGASIARLDHVNWSIVAPSWDSLAIYVFDPQGNVRSGWPFPTTDPVWSSVAIGDLDNDGSDELVFASNGTLLYALRANGTEWRDGDSNGATAGVFKVLGTGYNYGTPALADLDDDGQTDIVYASTDAKLHARRHDGTNLPGFPANIGGGTSSSVAIGHLDGVSDTQFEIVVTSNNDSLYVFKSDGGRRSGFPVGIRFQGTSRNPSPALADMNADGFLDIVASGTDGKVYVYDRTGAANPNFANSRYSAITDGYASESSPVVADIDGDGLPDVVQGDENGMLGGVSGTGLPLPGFPIQLGGEVRGTAALCDCDGDGMSEIVVSSWDQNTYIWDYDFAFSPAGDPPWPQFHHDARRTGRANAPVFVDVSDPGPSAAPPISGLSPPLPNPARTSARIAWAVPADRAGADLDLSVYDLAGRQIVQLASGKAREGRFGVDWDLRPASGGSRLGSGIYFLRFRLGPHSESRKLVVLD